MAKTPNFTKLNRYLTNQLGHTEQQAAAISQNLYANGMRTANQRDELLATLRSRYNEGLNPDLATPSAIPKDSWMFNALSSANTGDLVNSAFNAGKGQLARVEANQAKRQAHVDSVAARQEKQAAAIERSEAAAAEQQHIAEAEEAKRLKRSEAAKRGAATRAKNREAREQERIYREERAVADERRFNQETSYDRTQASTVDEDRDLSVSSSKRARDWQQAHAQVNIQARVNRYNQEIARGQASLAQRKQAAQERSDAFVADYNANATALREAANAHAAQERSRQGMVDYYRQREEAVASIGDRVGASGEAATATESGLLTNSVYQSKMREQYGRGYFSNNALKERFAEDKDLLDQLKKDYNSLSAGDDSLTRFNDKYGTNVTHNSGAFSSLEQAQSDFLTRRLEKGPGVSNYLWGNRVPETAAGIAIGVGAINVALGDGRRSNAQLYSSPF